MKLSRAILTLALLVVAAVPAARSWATVIYVDEHWPNDGLFAATLDETTPSYSFTHDIIQHGFQVGTLVRSALLEIVVRTGRGDEQVFQVAVDASVFDPVRAVDTGGMLTIDLGLFALNVISQTGLLDVTLSWVSGAPTYFKSSTLTVAVPEPGTLGMLGAALLGLGLMRRIRR